MRTDSSPLRGGLHRQMLFYVAFLSTVFLTMAVEVTSFLRGPRFAGALKALLPGEPAEVDPLVSLAVLKVCVMLGILLAALALVMLLFVKRIASPLEKILAGAQAIRSGNLAFSVPAEGSGELRELALCLNELSANLQEVMLLAGSVSRQARGDLDRLRDSGSPEVAASVTKRLEDALGQLDSLLADFVKQFYVSGHRV